MSEQAAAVSRREASLCSEPTVPPSVRSAVPPYNRGHAVGFAQMPRRNARSVVYQLLRVSVSLLHHSRELAVLTPELLDQHIAATDAS